MTLGFTMSGPGRFQPVWANDINPDALKTYCRNFGNHAVQGHILDILEDANTVIPEAEVVIGGPPCQGFSLLNKNRLGDDRRNLWRPFLKIVQRSGAQIFLMENVPQLLGTEEHTAILEYADKLGFSAVSAKLCAADYGVPQTRHRAFILGFKFGDANDFFPPLKTHFNPHKGIPKNQLFTMSGYISRPEPWKTVRDAIGCLPPPI